MAILFSACQKDGVFNPSKKIQEIVSVIDGEQQLEETWHWDGNLLKQIDYYYLDEISDVATFTYDKNRLETEEHPLFNEITKYIYDGGKLVRNDFYKDNQLYGAAVYEREHGKISRINITTTELEKMSNILHHIFPPQICKQIQKYETAHLGTKDDTISYIFLLTWSNGNVTNIDFHLDSEDFENDMTFKATYDKYKNPFKGSANEYLSSESFLSTLSQNNITSMSIERRDTTSYVDTYTTYSETYEYEDDFPVSITIKSLAGESKKMYIYK